MENIELKKILSDYKNLVEENKAKKKDSANQLVSDNLLSAFSEIREKLFEKFLTIPFPTQKNEEWRFTSVKPVISKSYSLGDGNDCLEKEEINKYLFDESIYTTVVFINGNFCEKLSDLSKLRDKTVISSLENYLSNSPKEMADYFNDTLNKNNDPFVLMNAALSKNGIVIRIPDNTVIDSPIQIIYITKNNGQFLSQPHNLFLFGKNSSAKILETYAGEANNGEYFTNAYSQIVLDENASVEMVKLQNEALDSYHISNVDVIQKRTSNFSSYNVNFGGVIVRNNINVNLEGTGTETVLNGLSLGKETQHIDNHTLISHNNPHCNSHQLYKSIHDGKSRGVFNGKIFVKQDAQKTNAFQENKNLILSDDALVNAKPQLEIFADDVKCTHGATIGQLDKDALFYLKSRGFGEAEAKATLIYAFASDAVHSISLPFVRDRFEEILSQRLLTIDN